MWERFKIKNNQKEHLSLIHRGPRLILLLAQGETPISEFYVDMNIELHFGCLVYYLSATLAQVRQS